MMMATMEIVAQEWTGWNQVQSKPETYELQVYPGKQLSVMKQSEKDTAGIKEVNEDSFTIVTSGFAPKKGWYKRD